MLTTSGAAIATKISKTMKPSETSATRSWRNRRQNSCSGERAGDIAAAVEELERIRPRTAAAQQRRCSSERVVMR